MKLVLAAAAALFLSAGASAQELWQGVSVGDTLDEVRSVFPDAVRPDPPVNYDGSDVDLMLDQHQIAEFTFDVYFMSVDDRVEKVRLLMSLDATGETPREFTYRNIMRVLSERYGAPFHAMPVPMEGRDFIQRLTNEFRNDDLRVEVNCIFCLSQNAILHVTYSAVESRRSQGF